LAGTSVPVAHLAAAQPVATCLLRCKRGA